MLTWNVAATAWLQQQMGDLIVSVFALYRVDLTVKLSITFNLDATFGSYNLFKMLTCNYVLLFYTVVVYRCCC